MMKDKCFFKRITFFAQAPSNILVIVSFLIKVFQTHTFSISHLNKGLTCKPLNEWTKYTNIISCTMHL